MSDDEWDETPVRIERRPSGTHVISVRVPADLAMAASNRADQDGQRLSDVVRDALEAHLRPCVTLAVTHSDRVRVSGFSSWPPVTSSGNSVVGETQYLHVPVVDLP